jgi:hypothetical protein
LPWYSLPDVSLLIAATGAKREHERKEEENNSESSCKNDLRKATKTCSGEHEDR